jgi:hypothetical protein
MTGGTHWPDLRTGRWGRSAGGGCGPGWLAWPRERARHQAARPEWPREQECGRPVVAEPVNCSSAGRPIVLGSAAKIEFSFWLHIHPDVDTPAQMCRRNENCFWGPGRSSGTAHGCWGGAAWSGSVGGVARVCCWSRIFLGSRMVGQTRHVVWRRGAASAGRAVVARYQASRRDRDFLGSGRVIHRLAAGTTAARSSSAV